MKPSEYKEHIPADKFRLIQENKNIHDVELKTKPVGYLRDAWRRFCRNKSSVIALYIIIAIVLFSIITPFTASHSVSYADNIYIKKIPKNDFLSNFGICTGVKTYSYNDRGLAYTIGIGVAAEDGDAHGATIDEGLKSQYSPVKTIGSTYESSGKTMRDCGVDVYLLTGFTYMQVSQDEYANIRNWQEANGLQVIYPMVDINNEYCADASDANYWFKSAPNGAALDANDKKVDITNGGELCDNYVRNAEGEVQYSVSKGSNMLYIRVLYYNYYQYINGSTPQFLLGTDGQGYDIAVRMAAGIRISLLLAVFVSIINLGVGTVYGAIEGYYGGTADLIMERITDILSNMPTIVVATLCNLYLVATGKMSSFGALMFTFCIAGWLGIAYRVRTQFYRYKGQEYVLAARTLGAKDLRLMFYHILPNSLGTIITSTVLVIPGVIYSESSLSYLGIINLNGPNMTSLGTLLANGSNYLYTAPHIILWPCIIISLLMISFNLFGNGLRDAFNPSLRGSEEA